MPWLELQKLDWSMTETAGVYSMIQPCQEAVARKKSDDRLQVVEKMKDDEIRCLRI
jgi:hypothetical protein